VTGLVLAAGLGKRLAPLTDDQPKGLIELGGRSLLARLLDGLQEAGLREVAIVVGHRQEQIRTALGPDHRGMPLRYLANPLYERGPRLSLWTGREVFGGDDVVLADGDVLFAPALLSRVVHHPAANVFLGEPDYADTGEEMVLYLTGEAGAPDRVRAIRRGVAGPPARAFDRRAEWVGFVKVGRAAGADLARGLDTMVRTGQVDGDYETALDGLLDDHLFTGCSTDGLPWIEIDFPQDLQAAETEILPRLSRLR
jgi:choline kinase